MRQPLWVINISLLMVLIVGEILFFLLQSSIPRKASLEPSIIPLVEKKIVFDVDVKQIYGVNDLFGTYVPEVPVLIKEEEFHLPPIPDLPKPLPLSIPVEKQPVFIAPLAVTLKGIVYLHNDQDKNMVMVQFNDSKEEHNYKVGDLIKDAQVLKIFPNRVLVVRSNGQQETLYLREADAQKDLSYEEQKEIEAMKVSIKDGKYYIPLDAFVAQIRSLGQFIDLLDLTTVYKKGKSVGARVGRALKGTLGSKLGFENEDVIKKVDGKEVTDLNSRIAIYDQVVEKKAGDTLSVELERGGKLLNYTYVLSDKKEVAIGSDVKKTETLSSGQLHDIEEQKKKILEQRVKLAPTAHQIQMDEQKKLLEARRKNLLSGKYNFKKV